MQFRIEVLNKNDDSCMDCAGEQELFAVYDGEYKEGDCIRISCTAKNTYIILKLDDCMDAAFVYLKDSFAFKIPFDENKLSYNPRCFTGNRHYLFIREASKDEIRMSKNLAFNPYDCHDNISLFPHAGANVETRGESVFAARNAIDGLIANTFHGEWPYSSWGINRNPQAELSLNFGRRVRIQRLVLYLRADFPHDAWWKSADIHFSDGSTLEVSLKKTGTAQSFSFPPKTITQLTVNHLIKADDSSPFPALTQIQVYGTEE